jgi:predicted amidohydrolase YtcJ
VGITGETEEPPEGMIERDLGTGEPNGVLFEMDDFLRSRITSPLSQNELDWGIDEANRQYLSMGITSIAEATVANDLAQWGTLSYRLEKLRSRIYMMIGAKSIESSKRQV